MKRMNGNFVATKQASLHAMSMLVVSAALSACSPRLTQAIPTGAVSVVAASEETSEYLHDRCVYLSVEETSHSDQAIGHAGAIGANVVMPIGGRSREHTATRASVTRDRQSGRERARFVQTSSWSDTQWVAYFACNTQLVAIQ